MPFDGPNLPSLVEALRNLPDDFRWNYECSGTCALGLAERLWPKWPVPEKLCPWVYWRRVFGLSSDVAYEVFFNAGFNKSKNISDVTPDDVADLLEAHLT